MAAVPWFLFKVDQIICVMPQMPHFRSIWDKQGEDSGAAFLPRGLTAHWFPVAGLAEKDRSILKVWLL